MTAKQNTILGTSFFLFLYIISTVIFHDNFHDGWGYYKEKNYKQAHTIWLPLAEQGNARAQFHMGKMYDQGEGVPQDYNEAFKWYELAAKQGYAQGKTYIYRIAKKGVAPAFKFLTDQANNGVAEAQFHMGKMYDQGEGVPQDYNEAFKWYRLAAEQGYGQGKTYIYRIAKKGVAPALKVLTDQANKGVAEAQFHMGKMYDQGEGVPQDYNEAFQWYRLAAKQGYAQGETYIYQLAKKAVAPALKVLTDQANNGVAEAQVNLGSIVEQGLLLPQDFSEAFQWYRLAAKQGYGPSKHYIYQLAKKGVAPALKVLTDQANNGVAEAQFHMGEMYDLGEGVPQDYNEAFKWYGLAAKQGYFSAQTHLGNMYDLGHGVSQDFNEAINRYRFAANRGHAQAQFNLGVMFYKGRGVIQDYLLADIWFIRSSLQKNQEAFKYISLVEKLMSPQQRKKAQQMAKYWERWD